MESHEKKSDQAESQADRLGERGEEVDRRIEETKSDWQSKQGSVPGMEPEGEGPEGGEVADEGEEPDATSAD